MMKSQDEATYSGAHGLHHICIMAKDLERTVAFYVEAFGAVTLRRWSALFLEDGTQLRQGGVMLAVGTGGTHIEIFASDAGAVRPSHPSRGVHHFCLAVKDCDAAFARARSAGAGAYRHHDVDYDGTPLSLSVDEVGEPVIRSAFVEGPDGEIIQLLQDLAPSAL
jgi:catechol 2,3-dioxygenase-like lactoylglutathione lyase family enzyme